MWYDAQYCNPPKATMDTAIEQWKYCHPAMKLDISKYDDMRLDWISRDAVDIP